MAGTCWAIVLGAGKDQELAGGAEVAFLGIGNRPAIAHPMCAVEICRDVTGIVVAAPRERVDMVRAMKLRFGYDKLKAVLAGGQQRLANVEAALDAFEDDVEWAVLLESARPVAGSAMVSAVLDAAQKTGAASTAEAIEDPVMAEVRKGEMQLVAARAVWVLQTPQAYRVPLLRKALAAWRKRRGDGVELPALIEGAGGKIRLVPSPRMNLRLRTADDLSVASNLLR